MTVRATLATLLAMLLAPFALVGAAEPTRITYMSWYSGSLQDIELEIIAEFNARNPDIVVEKIGGDPRKTLLTLIAGGTPPDTAALGMYQYGTMIPDIALDITREIQASGIGLNMYFPNAVERFATRDGKLYGLPWGFGFYNLFVNLDLFDVAGIPAPADDWTLEDMRETARRLTADTDGDGIANRLGLSNRFATTPETPPFTSNGTFVVNPATLKTDIDTPEFYEAVQFIADMEHQDGTAGAGDRAGFLEGKFAMYSDWQSTIPYFVANNSHESARWAMVYWPKGDAPQTSYGVGHIISVIKDSKNKDAAIRFVLYWAHPDVEARLGRTGLYPQTMAGLREMAENLQLPPGYTIDQAMGPLLNLPPRMVIPPYEVPGYTDALTNLIRPALISVLDGQQPARIAFTAIADQVNAVLAEAAAQQK